MSASAPEVFTSTTAEDEATLDEFLSFIRQHESQGGRAPEASYYLSGAYEGDRVELTEGLYNILKRAAEALRRGQSVNILAVDQEITTQQAAEILGVSRPTVVKLIDDGQLRATVPGTVRRKLRLRDVLKYRDELHERRSDFIAQSSAEHDDDVDEAEAAELLAEIRTQR
ncbi:excisionase family DNA-binding protein [Enemella sp. A6]|uniref:excisionase family DNA-binding protein n=1 Tax=Enemella sp. A6 TaxID=3440152 RepID=UPI003EBCD8CF